MTLADRNVPLRHRVLARVLAKSHRLDFWERAVRAHETADRIEPPEPGGILFTGSSTIRYWYSLGHDMAPLRVVNRGFGGALTRHVTHNFARLVVPHAPRVVVLYAGDNDLGLASGLSLDEVLRELRTLLDHARALLPGAELVTLDLKPSKLRRRRWPEMREVNRELAAWAASTPHQHHVQLAHVLSTPDGEADGSLLRWDGLHLNGAGYARISQVIQPFLRARFG